MRHRPRGPASGKGARPRCGTAWGHRRDDGGPHSERSDVL